MPVKYLKKYLRKGKTKKTSSAANLTLKKLWRPSKNNQSETEGLRDELSINCSRQNSLVLFPWHSGALLKLPQNNQRQIAMKVNKQEFGSCNNFIRQLFVSGVSRKDNIFPSETQHIIIIQVFKRSLQVHASDSEIKACSCKMVLSKSRHNYSSFESDLFSQMKCWESKMDEEEGKIEFS